MAFYSLGQRTGLGAGPSYHRPVAGGLRQWRTYGLDIRVDRGFPPALGEAQQGELKGAVQQVAQQARPVVAEALERIRSSPVVHADETGWRENGVNGYVWTFSTSTERYFLRLRRGRGGEWWTRSWASPSVGFW